jgi:hypothetical protein
MTSQGLMPAKNAGLSSSHRPGNFDSGHFELFNFLGRLALLAGIKPRDVIMHKVLI